MSLPPPVFECQDLGYTYGTTFTLHNINLTIQQGEIICLLGPNGSGKTTLFHLMAGNLMPLWGTVFSGRENLHRHRHRVCSRIAAMPFRPAATTLRTPYFFWQAYGQSFGMTYGEVQHQVARLAPAMAMDKAMHKAYGKLSLGMQQKMALVAAFLPDVPIRLLDEPFSGGIDPLAMEVLAAWIEKERGEGRTILFSSQMTEHAERLADKVIVLRDGRLAAFGSPADIIQLAAIDPSQDRPFVQAYLAVAEEAIAE